MTPYFGSIETLTRNNTFFRQVLFTAAHTQLVVMCLQPGEEIGQEVHSDVDQFFRVEKGEATFVIGGNEEHLARDGDAVVVPAGTRHNVLNRSTTAPLRLYTLYSPPNHADGTVHRTKAEAEMAEAAHHPV
jgi:mannose-6-phosphate isomerase-like protein (cupin superfamily)